MNIELKPCPFCGGEAEMIDVKAYISPRKRTIYRVECKKGIECPGMPGTCGYDTEREAAAAWNTRAYEEDGRKTGKRIVINTAWGKRTVCSECGTRLSAIKAHYCHHCGTRLEVGE